MKIGTGARESFSTAVERLGGKLLPDPCEGTRIAAMPDVGLRVAHTCECGTLSRAAVPYHGSKDFAVFCAVCDSAFDFPRIRGAA